VEAVVGNSANNSEHYGFISLILYFCGSCKNSYSHITI